MRAGELDRRRRQLGDALDELGARHPLTCHGLSLSLGGTAPLDETFLPRVRRFLDAPPRAAVQRTPELLQRRRPALRPAADPVHRRGRAPRRRAHPPRAGPARPPHRGRERLLLRRARYQAHGRESTSSTPCWPRPTATCCSTSTTSTSTRSTTATTPRDSSRAAGATHRLHTMSPATSTRPTTSRSTPTARAVKDDGVGAARPTPTAASACARRCSNATSISRRCAELLAEVGTHPRAAATPSRRASTRHAAHDALTRLREQQFALARHLRDPARHAPPPADRRPAPARSTATCSSTTSRACSPAISR